MDKETLELRNQIAQNPKLAAEISEVLSRYKFDLPQDKVVVWGPVVVDMPSTIWEAYGILVNGIPRPDLLKAAYRFKEQFKI